MGVEKRQVTVALVLAYLLGFVLGCLVLGSLSSSSPEPVVCAGFLPEFICERGESSGRAMLNKASKARVNPPGSPPKAVEMPENAAPGAVVKFTVVTAPGAVCTIRYQDPLHIDVQLPELSFIRATSEGGCRWIWQIPPDSPSGVGMLTVGANGQAATFFFRIR